MDRRVETLSEKEARWVKKTEGGSREREREREKEREKGRERERPRLRDQGDACSNYRAKEQLHYLLPLVSVSVCVYVCVCVCVVIIMPKNSYMTYCC